MGGGITTFMVGAVLFWTKLQVFNKFAVLITSTVFFSLVFSFFGFGSLAHLCGPTRNCGSINCCCLRKYDDSLSLEKRPPRPSKENPKLEVDGNLQEPPTLSLHHNSFNRKSLSPVEQNPERIRERFHESDEED